MLNYFKLSTFNPKIKIICGMWFVIGSIFSVNLQFLKANDNNAPNMNYPQYVGYLINKQKWNIFDNFNLDKNVDLVTNNSVVPFFPTTVVDKLSALTVIGNNINSNSVFNKEQPLNNFRAFFDTYATLFEWHRAQNTSGNLIWLGHFFCPFLNMNYYNIPLPSDKDWIINSSQQKATLLLDNSNPDPGTREPMYNFSVIFSFAASKQAPTIEVRNYLFRKTPDQYASVKIVPQNNQLAPLSMISFNNPAYQQQSLLDGSIMKITLTSFNHKNQSYFYFHAQGFIQNNLLAWLFWQQETTANFTALIKNTNNFKISLYSVDTAAILNQAKTNTMNKDAVFYTDEDVLSTNYGLSTTAVVVISASVIIGTALFILVGHYFWKRYKLMRFENKT